MIKFLSNVFVYLWGIVSNPTITAGVRGGLSTLADLTIVSGLAAKDPWIKLGEMVFFVPKQCIKVAKFILDFMGKHKILTTGVLVALGFSLFSVFRGMLLKEGISNIGEFFKNIFFKKDEILNNEEFLSLVDELATKNDNEIQEQVPRFIDKGLNGHNFVELKFNLDFDNSGEVSVAEYFKGRRIERLLSRCQPEMLELLQIIAEDNIDYPDMLKYYGYYRYENYNKETV